MLYTALIFVILDLLQNYYGSIPSSGGGFR